jgi:hypothetical protein
MPVRIPPATLPKLDPVGKQRLEDLFHGLVDRPHDRHAVEQVLAELDEGAADKACGQESEQGERDERDDQAIAGHAEWQIGLGAQADRDERPHRVVHPVDEPPVRLIVINRPDQMRPVRK